MQSIFTSGAGRWLFVKKSRTANSTVQRSEHARKPFFCARGRLLLNYQIAFSDRPFSYPRNKSVLHCEDVSLVGLAKKYGTPCMSIPQARSWIVIAFSPMRLVIGITSFAIR